MKKRDEIQRWWHTFDLKLKSSGISSKGAELVRTPIPPERFFIQNPSKRFFRTISNPPASESFCTNFIIFTTVICYLCMPRYYHYTYAIEIDSGLMVLCVCHMERSRDVVVVVVVVVVVRRATVMLLLLLLMFWFTAVVGASVGPRATVGPGSVVKWPTWKLLQRDSHSYNLSSSLSVVVELNHRTKVHQNNNHHHHHLLM